MPPEVIDNDLHELSLGNEVNLPFSKDNRILNDTGIYYKGIVGMILCIIPAAIVGLVLVKISLEQSKVALKEYNDNPSLYKTSSIYYVKQGRKYASIGLGIFIFEIITLVSIMSLA